MARRDRAGAWRRRGGRLPLTCQRDRHSRVHCSGPKGLGPVAQSAEHRTFNPRVEGSIPSGPTGQNGFSSISSRLTAWVDSNAASSSTSSGSATVSIGPVTSSAGCGRRSIPVPRGSSGAFHRQVRAVPVAEDCARTLLPRRRRIDGEARCGRKERRQALSDVLLQKNALGRTRWPNLGELRAAIHLGRNGLPMSPWMGPSGLIEAHEYEQNVARPSIQPLHPI